jgi:hypothetical protein
VSALPFIDEYDAQIAASAEQVWAALVTSVSKLTPQLPRWLVVAWGLDPAGRSSGSKEALALGDSVAGFRTAAIEYELRFELEPLPTGGTRLRAQTSASFPGLKGALYRALVIGSGGHRVAVRRILARVGSRAERTGAARSAD